MRSFKVAGMMSGTSLDGLDIAFCEFREGDGKWRYEILHARTVPLGNEMSARLGRSMKMPAHELAALHVDLGEFCGSECLKFMKETGFEPELISSHGHTVFHQPEKGLTLQIGDGEVIAKICGRETVYDFRSGDVALGGQGAPLVPVGDALLFGEYASCLNLGGIANLSYTEKGQRRAYDITALNQVFNYLSEKAGFAFDRSGNLAASGKTDPVLLNYFENLAFYKTPGPKSLGKEWVDDAVIPQLKGKEIPDLMRTWSEHAAMRISAALNEASGKGEKVLVTGGGAKNEFFISQLGTMTKASLVIPGNALVDFKEAMIFAFLGLLRQLGRVNIFSSVTGAEKDSCGGMIAKP